MSQIVGPDGAEMRNFIISLVDWSSVVRVLDVGCGVGYDLYQIGTRINQEYEGKCETGRQGLHFCGIDVSREKIDIAITDVRRDDRYQFRVHNFADKLPFEDNYFDIVYSHNVLECAANKIGHLSELQRILKPGGQILCAHFDWDSAFFNGTDKQLIRKIVHAYADWQQDWMDACDGWMGRRMWGTIENSKLFEDAKLTTYQIVNTQYEYPYYGFKSVQGYEDMIAAKLISENDYRAFKADIDDSANRGDYLFSITTFIYLARKSH